MKFCTISIILSLILAFDGLINNMTHYMVFSAVNFFCTIFIYKEIIREWEKEMKREKFIESYEKIANNDCEKGKNWKTHEYVDISSKNVDSLSPYVMIPQVHDENSKNAPKSVPKMMMKEEKERRTRANFRMKKGQNKQIFYPPSFSTMEK